MRSKGLIDDFCRENAIRPKNAYRIGVSLANQPASTKRVHTKYTPAKIAEFATNLQHINPADR
jgi:hypothetical protein